MTLRDKFKAAVCALFRHSNILDDCFGQVYCGRCGAILGDTLAGYYQNPDGVSVNCDCEFCRGNLAKLTAVDWFLAKKPEWLEQPEGWSERRRSEARAKLRELEQEQNARRQTSDITRHAGRGDG